ncbi:ATP-binding protein [bacterium]|nr:ATP-binding protein [bacterium]MCI0607374.1 ATP-binding protein [bacterium]
MNSGSQKSLRILHIEDNLADAELIDATLRSNGLQIETTRVEKESELIQVLQQQTFDVALADYSLPSLDGLTVLRIIQQLAPDLPFILVTGSLGEELAVDMLKQGAKDFVLKGSLGRLASAVRRAIDLKNAEAAKAGLEKELRQIQKLDAIGQLAGGVAHDFNNILMVISSYCEILQMKTDPQDSNYKIITEIRAASDKGAILTRQLLAFSRKQHLEPRIVNLNQVLTEMKGILRHLIREDIDLTMQLQENLRKVKVDPGEIERIIINLVANARDAMPKGGKLLIETQDVDIQENHRQPVEPGSGLYASIRVSDTGIGMDQETLNHIFEPFFTTKEEGKGTGLGLSTVYGIIKQSGGHIEVTTELGKGTTFIVLFPAEP